MKGHTEASTEKKEWSNMGLFDKIFGAKKIGDYEIKKTVNCKKCGRKMFLVKGLPEITIGGPITEGCVCRACGSYLCFMCTMDLHSGHFKCCPQVDREGINPVRYIGEEEAKRLK